MVAFYSYIKTYHYTFFSLFLCSQRFFKPIPPNWEASERPCVRIAFENDRCRASRLLSRCRHARELRTYEKQRARDKEREQNMRTCCPAFGDVLRTKRSGAEGMPAPNVFITTAATSEIHKRSHLRTI